MSQLRECVHRGHYLEALKHSHPRMHSASSNEKINVCVRAVQGIHSGRRPVGIRREHIRLETPSLHSH
jgi:hypothetical protein